MVRLLMVTCLMIIPSIAAFADESFPCGGADVKFSFDKRSEGGEHVEAVLTVSRGYRTTVLRYDGNVDFIGGICARNGHKKPIVLFQAYCGGSACRDLDNWGIVDPSDLHVQLVPNDWNRKDAQKILGQPLPPQIDRMISIRDEARKFGLDW
jgi:hypothetical protein